MFLKTLSKMVKKSSTGFVVQISKLLRDACFRFTGDMDGTSTTMLDAGYVVSLWPKPTVPEFIAAKKKIGMEHDKKQKQKRTKIKLIQVVSDFEKKFQNSVLYPLNLNQN